MFCKAQITIVEGMSSTSQWCVPDAGQDEFAIDFDRSLSNLDVDISTTSSNNINATVFAVPEMSMQKDESKNNDAGNCESERCQTQCHPVSLVHGKKIRYSQLTDIDCSNSVKRFCLNKDMERSENVQTTRCRQYSFPTPEQLHASGTHFYSSGSMINTILSQVVQLPALPLPESMEQEGPFGMHSEFQYILMAPTSAAVKLQEETLTYLNQGQSYEIKIRKSGDITDLRGKLYRSIVHMGFQERRLQYIEREQIIEWQLQRPGERIIELDIPLTYGVIESSNCLQNINESEFLWDPMKDIGVFLKVNCISTEFTPKKHGGEKGVPLRIVIETYSQDESCERLHAASCQVKVFKPKGADRKHKTEAEKLCKKPPSERDKYHPQYEFTFFKDLISMDSWTLHQTRSSSHSTNVTTPSSASSSPVSNHYSPRNSIHGLSQDSQSDAMPYRDDLVTPNDIQDSSDSAADTALNLTLLSSNTEAVRWLQQHMFGQFLKDFSNFSGSDLMNLKRHDLIDICGIASGIRLYNSLHPKPGCSCLTIYVRLLSQHAFQAIYFKSYKVIELEQKLKAICGLPAATNFELYLSGPSDIHIIITDEVIQNMAEESVFIVEMIRGHSVEPTRILLKEFNG